VLFCVGRDTRRVLGGRLGIHYCYKGNEGGHVVIPDPECNAKMAANAIAHGVPWGVVKGFSNEVRPSSIMWLSGEDAESWGFMKWSDADNSHGIACLIEVSKVTRRPPLDVTAKNANDVTCRLNAGFSRIYEPNGNKQQGFSDAYRKACERVGPQDAALRRHRHPPLAVVHRSRRPGYQTGDGFTAHHERQRQFRKLLEMLRDCGDVDSHARSGERCATILPERRDIS
jgi:hypothetical protein